MVHRDGSRIRCFTRNGHEWGERFPGIVLAARRLKAESLVIAVRLSCCATMGDQTSTPFEVRAATMPPCCSPSICSSAKGKDLRDEPLIERKRKLLRLLGKTMNGIQFVDHFPDDGKSVFQHACMMGLEGIVSKRIDAPYRSGRSKVWLKSKNPNSETVRREGSED